MPRIKAVFFDIDDTLFPSTMFSTLARKNALNAMISVGLDIDSKEGYQILQRIIKHHGSNYSYHFNALLEALDIPYDPKIVAAGVIAYHNTKAMIQPFPEVPKTLFALREDGRDLYVASDGNSVKQWDKLIRMNINLFFKDVFVSEDVGCEKSAKFFDTVLGRLGLRPRETVMVGDRLDRDIRPAAEIGMYTVRVLAGKHRFRPGKSGHTIKKLDQLPLVLKKIEKR